MKRIFAFIKTYAMTLSMLLGVFVGLLEWGGIWTWHVPHWMLPFLIFLMLFFTFLRISPRTLRLYPWHLVLLVFQVAVSFGLFYGTIWVSRQLCTTDENQVLALAQGIALCVLMPAATAAPVIAGKLGGSIPRLTAFTLLSSACSSVLIPLIFPVWNPAADMPFVASFLIILRKVGPVLLLPALVAWILRYMHHRFSRVRQALSWRLGDGVSEFLSVWNEIPFLLWMATLVILLAQITVEVCTYTGSWMNLLLMTIGALVTTFMQFYAGKYIGHHMPADGDPETVRITAGQALGQKNTTLGIWLATTYLNPVSALAPAAYIVFQNFFNAWQLSRVALGKKI